MHQELLDRGLIVPLVREEYQGSSSSSEPSIASLNFDESGEDSDELGMPSSDDSDDSDD
jgi:hypothetical protein